MDQVRRIHVLACALALATTPVFTACERTPQEAHEDAVEAQRSANEKIQEAKREAAETASDVQRKATEAETARQQELDEANRAAREKSAAAQAEANEKIREANTDIKQASASSELRVWAQRQLDELSNMIDAATVKVEKAPDRARAEYESEIKLVRESRDQLLTEVAKLDDRTISNSALFRADLDQRIDRLKDRLERIERRL